MAERSQIKDSSRGVNAADMIALALSLIWMAGAALFFTLFPVQSDPTVPFDSLRFVMTLMAVFLPVALIWMATAVAKSGRLMREESRRLQVAVDALRQSYLNDRQKRDTGGGLQPSVERKLNEIAQSARHTETALATFASSRDARRSPAPAKTPQAADDQPALALGTTVDETLPPVAKGDLIRALNFPDTEKDEAGFSALRRALRDHRSKQLIQASQDILTLLSQDGIYMDDMNPDRARPEIWRRFAKGERGKPVASLGGIRDRSSLALSAGRMREDTIFRDAAHHFLRKFDLMLQDFEETASDEELSDLGETRTARAFMLLGRVTGAFD